jgi:hypothetical protein
VGRVDPEAQALLTEIGIEYEVIAHDYMIGLEETETAALRAAGMQDVELTGEVAEAYLDAATGALWDLVEEASGAENRAMLEAEFTR